MPADLLGLGDVIQALRDIQSSPGIRDALETAAVGLQAKLMAATPVGYSGRLQKSVLSSQDEDQFLVGYEDGVETAGNPELDSVLKPKTRGKSVIWVSTDRLDEILEAEAEDFSQEALSIFESEFLGGVA